MPVQLPPATLRAADARDRVASMRARFTHEVRETGLPLLALLAISTAVTAIVLGLLPL